MSAMWPYPIEPYRWGTIFGTLSLDVAAPFTEQMGLQLPQAGDFAADVRKIIADFREVEAHSHGVEPPFSEAVFDWASNEYGRGFTDHLYNWGQDVFQTGDRGDGGASLWNMIMRIGGLEGKKDRHVPPDFVLVIRKLLQQRAKLSVNRIEPASTWDKLVYERQQYDRLRNPMELVQATINHLDFVSAWNEAETLIGYLDLEHLQQWGREQLLGMGLPLDHFIAPKGWAPLPAPWR